jgi:hypothetical protein
MKNKVIHRMDLVEYYKNKELPKEKFNEELFSAKRTFFIQKSYDKRTWFLKHDYDGPRGFLY